MAKKARVYDGTAWQELASAQTDLTAYSTTAQMNTAITAGVGLVPILTQTIGTAVSSVTVNNAFSATYDNYLIIFSEIDFSATNNVNILFNNATGSNYKYATRALTYGNVSGTGTSSTSNTGCVFATGSTEADFGVEMTVYSPFLTKVTTFTSLNSGSAEIVQAGGIQNQAVSHTGFSVTSSATMTGGTIRVYGYKN